MTVPLKAMPAEERPRERLLKLGAEQLSDEELVAIVLRTGVRGSSALDMARRLLALCAEKGEGNRLRYLLSLGAGDIPRLVPGLGAAKLSQLLAALQLGQRAAVAERPRRVELNNPRAVYEYLAPRMSHLDHEQFQVILLNAKNNVLDVECVSEGTLTASLVHPREVFKPAIRRAAHAVILVHNHPSGDPTPSREDREITQRLIDSGRVLGIEVLDHLVIGDGRFVSFRERGLMNRA